MISWQWLILVFVFGGLLGFVLIGLLAAAKWGDGDI